MNDREKLIELIYGAKCVETWDYYNDEPMKPCPIERLADHLLANDVIVPPCKVGDKVYMLVTRKTHSFVFEEGKKMLRVDNQHTFIKETYLTKLNFFKVIDNFGKTVFLTKEEAEEKLKELNKNANVFG